MAAPALADGVVALGVSIERVGVERCRPRAGDGRLRRGWSEWGEPVVGRRSRGGVVER